MAKIVLDDTAGGYNLTAINNNFNKIEQALQDQVLYRDNPDGEPNSLQTDVDANGKKVYNLPEPTLLSQAARLQDVQNSIGDNRPANLIPFTPYGSIVANTVQGAIQEVSADADVSTAKLAILNGTGGSAAIGFGSQTVEDRLNLDFNGIANARDKRFAGGAKFDGVTDDTAALQAWASSSIRRKTVGGSGTAIVRSTVTFNANTVLEGDGYDTLFDATTGTFVGGFVFNVEGSYTALPALNAVVPGGNNTLVFASAPSVSANTVIGIYSTLDYSFNGIRNYYRSGEFCRVHDVSGNTVTLWGRLYDGYSTVVSMYKINTIAPVFKNFRIKCPATNDVAGIRIAFGDGAVVENVICFNSSYAGLVFDRCVNSSIANTSEFCNYPSGGSQYGAVMSNSQDCIIRGSFYGTRHGVALGGSDFTLAVPTRNIHIVDSYIANSTGGANPSADVHGGCESIHYTNCRIDGGANLGGKDVFYRGCTIRSGVGNGNSSIAVYGSEILGGTMLLDNCTIESYGNSNTTSWSPIDVTIDVNCKYDVSLVIRNCKISAPALDATGNIISAEIYGATKNINADIQNNVVEAVSALCLYFQRTYSGTGAAATCVVDKTNWIRAGGYLAYPMTGAAGYTTTRFRIQRQSGSTLVPTTTAASLFATSPLPFNYLYPKIPVSVATLDGTSVSALQGASVGVATIYATTAASIRPAVLNAKGVNFDGAYNYTINWSVGLDEI